MNRCGKQCGMILLMAALGIGGGFRTGHAQDCNAQTHKDPGLMTADVALARPVGAVATVTGFAIYLLSSPFSALGGNSKEAWESLVESPANYTFKRPLGHFDCEPPPKPVQNSN